MKEERREEIINKIKRTLVGEKNQIYDRGKYLCELKRDCKHGEFMKAIEDNFEDEDLSYPSAYNSMRVYLCCEGKPELIELFTLRPLYLITAVAPPSVAGCRTVVL